MSGAGGDFQESAGVGEPLEPRAGWAEPGWPHGPWATPASLRRRDDADRIEGQMVLSGRWRRITDDYWNTCVIEVPWRIAVVNEQSCEPSTTPGADVGPKGSVDVTPRAENRN